MVRICVPDATVNKAISKLQTVKSGYVHIPAVFDWAVKKKKNIDVFMNFIYYNHSLDLAPKEVRDKEKPIAALNKYRKKVNLPQTKYVEKYLVQGRKVKNCLFFL